MDLRDAHGVFSRLGLGHEGVALMIGGEHDFQNGFVRRRNLLRDPAERGPGRHADSAVSGGIGDFLADQAQQCRLARAVAPDEPDLPAVGNLGARAFKQGARLNAVIEI